MLGMLEEGTTSLDAQALSEAKERLGVEIDTGSSLDRSTVTMSALSANLAPSLALVGDVIKQSRLRARRARRGSRPSR